MRIEVLLPEILERPTGGNLFNRHVLDYLEIAAEVERRVIAGDLDSASGTADMTLVDSLLLVPAAERLRARRSPHVLVAHYLHVFEPARHDSPEAAAERALLPFLDGVVTTSEYCRQVLVEEGLDEGRTAVVTPGLAPGYTGEATRRPPGTPRLLTVSTLLEGKGLVSLLEVLEGLLDLDWTWEIAGDPGLDPDFSAEFHRRLERSPVAARTRFHGAVAPERVVEIYDRCHVFVLPSRFETCSMATMEAMARALPVVAFQVGGLTERLPAATADLLVPLGDVEQLASRLRGLLENPERAARLGQENHRASRAFPSWEDSGETLWTFLQEKAGTP